MGVMGDDERYAGRSWRMGENSDSREWGLRWEEGRCVIITPELVRVGASIGNPCCDKIAYRKN